MSVLIKGMEMPTNCRACPLATRFFDGEDVCAMLGTYVHDRDREDDCPLVHVPPHGRLIDADAIPYNKIMIEDDDFYYGITQPRIERMPTIIPAEEVET